MVKILRAMQPGGGGFRILGIGISSEWVTSDVKVLLVESKCFNTGTQEIEIGMESSERHYYTSEDIVALLLGKLLKKTIRAESASCVPRDIWPPLLYNNKHFS